MEDRDLEVTQYVATFENHYKAMLFKKGMGRGCILRPVPRLLSSSCGTAAFFQGDDPVTLTEESACLVEAVYRYEGEEGDSNGRYIEVLRQ